MGENFELSSDNSRIASNEQESMENTTTGTMSSHPLTNPDDTWSAAASLGSQLGKEVSTVDVLDDSIMTEGFEKQQEATEIVNPTTDPIFKDDNLESEIECGMSSDNSGMVSNEQELMENTPTGAISPHPRSEELKSEQIGNLSPSTDHETNRIVETGHSEHRGRKVAVSSISEDNEENVLQSCQVGAQDGLSSSGTALEITSDNKTENLTCPDISIYETNGPSRFSIEEGSKGGNESFCEYGSENSENSNLPDIRNQKPTPELYLPSNFSTPVIIEAMELESDSMSPPDLEFDPRLPGPVDYADSDTVSELDTMSEYNSPVSRATPSRIPRIQRSNSLMSFKRRCSLQSLPVSASISSRRSSISSRRSSTMSIDERQPWNYGAGGTPYQKLYPFGKPKRLSVDNYYD